MISIVIGLVTFLDRRRLVQVVPDAVKSMWSEWALRGLILISLTSHIILGLLGNLRKYNPRTRIRITVWCNYLLAYAVTSAGLGIITRTALDVCNTSHSNSPHHKLNTSELMSFWAPFLLLHLGGPDTITAFASEDNELWLRHFLEIASQVVVASYILLLSWPGCSHLPQLSILVYVAGFTKCFERVQALRSANTDNLRDSMIGPADPGPNYPKFLEDLKLRESEGFVVQIDEVPEDPPPVYDHAYSEGQGMVISKAYDLFQTFKRLFVDLILTFEDLNSSLSYFGHLLKSGDAFRVVEIELAFAYDMLYTKAGVVYTVRGLVLRVTSVSVLLLLPVGFFFLCDTNHYQMVDVAITYILIGAAVLMEIFSVLTMLGSDWTHHWMSQRNHTRNNLIFRFLKQPTKRRWSSSIAQLDLLSVALEEKPASLLPVQKFFGVDQYRVNHRYKTYSKVSDDLEGLICSQFGEFVGGKSDPKELCTHKGFFAIQKNGCDTLLWSINKVEFDQSILIWHIATTLCYYSEDEDEDKDHDKNNIDIHRKESKHISDYLLYLLVSYPAMLPIGIGMIRYRDTCAEATRFFKEKGPTFSGKSEACNMLLEVDSLQVDPSKVKGDRCKSALFDGCRLALTLREMNKEHMWKVMTQVWIEILAYAATHCRVCHHEQQLRKGGEFLTHVWLLMAHLGITEQFQVSQGHSRAMINVLQIPVI